MKSGGLGPWQCLLRVLDVTVLTQFGQTTAPPRVILGRVHANFWRACCLGSLQNLFHKFRFRLSNASCSQRQREGYGCLFQPVHVIRNVAIVQLPWTSL